MTKVEDKIEARTKELKEILETREKQKEQLEKQKEQIQNQLEIVKNDIFACNVNIQEFNNLLDDQGDEDENTN